ncbi:hypothetical protein [Enterococcus italicus]|uniref:Uncharacterized protein n=1 Tax=Enterococcus italicus (strain DSM 15952 / CCUG 50447 / LMG 22039 / TP 1.5) TaxID=888064 RepID=E6LG91_ENTI1|nr:hypothetical protein [Enterococcus italicus]EFU73778.1 hypothetical protein HMPREF9088_1381 [Enterococcus italicus DSM 15952]OJG56681.1 hypothetical protein RT43_GL001562 [Enterococcus italicus DSM 15952]
MKVSFLDSNQRYDVSKALFNTKTFKKVENAIIWKADCLFFQVGVFLSFDGPVVIEESLSSNYHIDVYHVEKTEAYVGEYLGYGSKTRKLPFKTENNYKKVYDMLTPYRQETLKNGWHT